MQTEQPINNPPPAALLIPRDLAQAIIDYLQQRPFVEVYTLINGMIKAGSPTEQPAAEVTVEPDTE